MKQRQDMVGSRDSELEVFQLTAGSLPSSHFYCEAQIMTPDSRRLVLHTAAYPHGRIKGDPRHRFLLCDLDDKGRLSTLVDEPDATGPSLSPDGETLYYFVDKTFPGGGSFHIRSIGIDGTGKKTLLSVKGPIPGSRYRASMLYPLSTISSDGKRLAISCFLGDGRTENMPWGLLVFDLVSGRLTLPLVEETFCNIHPQYCRSKDHKATHDILVQENHGCAYKPDGSVTFGCVQNGCEIHVIRDDGSNKRSFAWGLTREEGCQGHQCWRGTSKWAITSTGDVGDMSRRLIAGLPKAKLSGLGKSMPGGIRVDISANVKKPDFWHFATDRVGRRLISDGDYDQGGALFVAELPSDPKRSPKEFLKILQVKGSKITNSNSHMHPFLSPDGKMAFFNSTESGLLQAYMLRGF